MQTAPASKTWTFVNSSLFIWMLSSVFLSFSPFLWNQWKARSEKEKLKERIHQELWSRFNQLTNIGKREIDSASLKWDRSSACQPRKDTDRVDCQGLVDVKEILFAFMMAPAQTSRPQFYAMYDEFATTPLLSLISQDLVLETDKVQQDSIRHGLFDLEAYKNLPLDRLVPPDRVNRIVGDFKNALYIHCWDN